MIRTILFLSGLFTIITLSAQTDELDNSQVLYYDFSNCSPDNMAIEDKSMFASEGMAQKTPLSCNGCGHEGSLRLSGGNYITAGEKTIPQALGGNFTISMLINPVTNNTNYLLFSRSEECELAGSIQLYYNPRARRLSLKLYNKEDQSFTAEAEVPAGLCWFHLSVTRDDNDIIFYVNGKRIGSSKHDVSFQNVSQLAPFRIGGGVCSDSLNLYESYNGYIDEVRVHNIKIDDAKATQIYTAVGLLPGSISIPEENRISAQPSDTVDVQIKTSCVESVTWSPSELFLNPNDFRTSFITKESSTIKATVTDDLGCVRQDSFELVILDKDDFNCQDIIVANAFTPNGDNNNDTFGIISGFIIDEFIQVDIYDSRSHLVFRSNDPEFRWDGTYEGEVLPVGAYYYKLRFVCDNNTTNFNGSVLLLK